MISVSLLRLPQVKNATGLKTAEIYKRMSQGSFPKPVKLGKRARAWRSDQIQEWILSLPPTEMNEQPSIRERVR